MRGGRFITSTPANASVDLRNPPRSDGAKSENFHLTAYCAFPTRQVKNDGSVESADGADASSEPPRAVGPAVDRQRRPKRV